MCVGSFGTAFAKCLWPLVMDLDHCVQRCTLVVVLAGRGLKVATAVLPQ